MNYQRVLLVTIILSLGTYAFLQYQKKPLTRNADSMGTNVIAFGDSLVYGVGSTEGNDLFSLVSKKLGIPIINKGVSGNTTQDALARLKEDVLSRDPKIVFVLLGGNDYLQRFDRSVTFDNLSSIIEQIQHAGAAVILIGVRGGIFGDHYEENYRELAKKYHTAYVSNILEGLITNRQYMYDSIHPNDKGYKIIAPRIEGAFREVLDESIN